MTKALRVLQVLLQIDGGFKKSSFISIFQVLHQWYCICAAWIESLNDDGHDYDYRCSVMKTRREMDTKIPDNDKDRHYTSPVSLATVPSRTKSGTQLFAPHADTRDMLFMYQMGRKVAEL